jgi:chaperonin GroES
MKNESGLHPLNDCVLVQVIVADRKSRGGIIIPEPQADRHDAASNDAYLVEMGPAAKEFWGDQVKPGDVIIFAKHAGNIKKGRDGKTYRLMRADDVWGLSEGVWQTSYDPRVSLPKAEMAEALAEGA